MSITAIGFVAVFCILLGFALVRHPVYGLLAYLWAFYNHPPHRWWGEGLPDLRWSFVAAIITLIATVRLQSNKNEVPWYKSNIARLLIAFLVWAWLQNFWAVNKIAHLDGSILFTKYIILFYIIYKSITEINKFEFFAFGHVLGCFIFGWVARNTYDGGRFESVGGPGVGDANTLAMHLVTGLVFAGFLLISSNSKKKWLAIICIPFILNGIILTSSRGAMLALIGAGLCSIYLSPKRYKKVVLLTGSLGVILLLILSHEIFWNRWESIWEKEESGQYESSAQSRIVLIKAGWQMAVEHPFGVGHKGHQNISRDYIPETYLDPTTHTRSAHNTIMALLVEHGFLGFLIFLIMWITLFRNIQKQIKLAGKIGETQIQVFYSMLIVAFIAYWIAGQFSNYLKAEVFIWIASLSAAMDNLNARRQKEIILNLLNIEHKYDVSKQSR